MLFRSQRAAPAMLDDQIGSAGDDLRGRGHGDRRAPHGTACHRQAHAEHHRRARTGACGQGVSNFLASRSLPPKLTVERVIAETRGERVRVYRSEPLLADSAAVYPATVMLDIAGLPANFMPLFAGGRTAFVPEGEQVVVHGGVSVEELIVPFVKVSYVIGTE